MICKRCGLDKEPHKTSKHLCDDCVKAENNRVAHYRQQNYNWMEVAKEACLEIWERQPAETDHEYHVWLRYRDAYPGKRPSYRDAAEEVGTSVAAVSKIASRWDFPARLQAWAKYCDELTLAQRRQEILDMNKKHVDMAATMHQKLQKAIENLDPYAMSPKDITSMMKMSAELERKARLDHVPTAGIISDDTNTALKQNNVKSDDIKEILTILGKAGVLDKNIGIRQTTEVVIKDDDM